MKAILFDLDGTLLPMDQDKFIQIYMGKMAERFAPLGVDPQKLISTIWKGTEAMIRNNRVRSNEETFWQCFDETMGMDHTPLEPRFLEFYKTDFQFAKASTAVQPLSAMMIASLKAKGIRLILATNPIFPRIATLSRIEWAGLHPEDFELITTYENSSSCKPNLNYYKEILEKTGLLAEDCLMIGNDVKEDMVVEKMGMPCWLVSDCLLHKELPMDCHFVGTMAEVAEKLEKEC